MNNTQHEKCPQDQTCLLLADVNHASQYVHTCRAGVTCKSSYKDEPEHFVRFLHSSKPQDQSNQQRNQNSLQNQNQKNQRNQQNNPQYQNQNNRNNQNKNQNQNQNNRNNQNKNQNQNQNQRDNQNQYNNQRDNQNHNQSHNKSLLPCKFHVNCNLRPKAEHRKKYSHPCSSGAACSLLNDPSHMIEFTHDNANEATASTTSIASTSTNTDFSKRVNTQSCWYGAECTRQDPVHFKKFTHPPELMAKLQNNQTTNHNQQQLDDEQQSFPQYYPANNTNPSYSGGHYPPFYNGTPYYYYDQPQHLPPQQLPQLPQQQQQQQQQPSYGHVNPYAQPFTPSGNYGPSGYGPSGYIQQQQQHSYPPQHGRRSNGRNYDDEEAFQEYFRKHDDPEYAAMDDFLKNQEGSDDSFQQDFEEFVNDDGYTYY